MLLILVALCVAGSALVTARLATLPERNRRILLSRAAAYGAERPITKREQLSLRERVLVPAVARMASLMLRLNPRGGIGAVESRLMAAGVQGLSARGLLALKGFLTLAGAVLGLVLWAAAGAKTGVMATFALTALGYIAPGYALGVRARRRKEQIQAALPDALDVLTVSVEAGLGFDAALAKLVEHMDGPLIDEFNLTLGELRVGESRQDAFKKLAERVDVPEVSAFVRALNQADQLGISLGRLLRVQAAEARSKRQSAAEEKAMKAPIKMLFPTVGFIFPAMFIVILGPAFLNLSQVFHL